MMLRLSQWLSRLWDGHRVRQAALVGFLVGLGVGPLLFYSFWGPWLEENTPPVILAYIPGPAIGGLIGVIVGAFGQCPFCRGYGHQTDGESCEACDGTGHKAGRSHYEKPVRPANIGFGIGAIVGGFFGYSLGVAGWIEPRSGILPFAAIGAWIGHQLGGWIGAKRGS